jgi:putative colanic acid biosynthesis glycosyltransferase WcaI
MRVVVHDYAGHAFPAQLARSLAGRGHAVLHLQLASFVSGKGRVEREPGDPPSLDFDHVDLGGEFAKYDVRRRIAHERRIGADLTHRIAAFGPDVVLSNAPLLIQSRLQKAAHALGAGFVFWQQDVISAAAGRVLGHRWRLLGIAAEQTVAPLEWRLLRRSDGVVIIAEDFRPLLQGSGVADERVTVIENWAPLGELPELPRDNPWARAHGLEDKKVFLYAGTLGFKHDPSLLLELARWAGHHDALVVVCSEGPGADWLEERTTPEDALRLLPYQPYARLPEVLASADVLVAVLEPEAGFFSVPSKVLTYLCAGRPLLAALPGDNLAARTVERSGGGIVVPPGHPEAMVGAAATLHAEPGLRAELGRNARAYAEAAFDISAITDRFEEVLEAARR